MKTSLQRLRWFHMTRAIGATLIAFSLLNPKDPDRGTLLWIGATFIGGEFVGKIETRRDK